MNFACSFSQIKIVNHVSGGSLVSFHLGPTTSSAHCTRGILCTLGLKCSSSHFFNSALHKSDSGSKPRNAPCAFSRGRTRLDPDGVKGPASADGRKTKICPSDKQLVRKVKGRAACFASAAGKKRSGAAQAARRRPWLLPPAPPRPHASAAVYSRDRCLAAQRCLYLR